MGFYIMILSVILGIILIVTGSTYLKKTENKLWNIITILAGITLVGFAVWLGYPK